MRAETHVAAYLARAVGDCEVEVSGDVRCVIVEALKQDARRSGRVGVAKEGELRP